MALQPGDTLLNGQYRILRQLGRGGFGFVYLAQDTLLGDRVAIKELIPALVGDEAILKRFLAEARATMRLSHENIVRTHNVLSDGGSYYIVMEYMAGGSLEAWLQAHGPLPAAEAVRVATEICAGLGYAHQRGVVHCDLKPANILFSGGGANGFGPGTAKIADFGIAHLSGEMLTRSWMTAAGFTAGTLPYMSPEQMEGVRDDPRLDIYALGAVLYRMLTGQPYLEFDQRETPAGQVENVNLIRHATPGPPSAHDRRIPAWLDRVVLVALAKRPEDRYPTAGELRCALLGTADTDSAPQIVPPIARSQVDRQRRAPLPVWTWILAGGVVALLAILVVLVALLARGMGAEQPVQPEQSRVAVIEVTATPSLEAASPPAATDTALPSASASPTLTPMPSPTLPPTETTTPTPVPTLPPTETPTPTPEPTLPPTETPAPQGGDRIAFASNRDGNYELYVMEPDGSNQQRLTNTSAEEWHPDWSPDGTRLVFQCASADGGSNVCVVNADGSGYAPITRWPAGNAGAQRPVWSPDGKQIAVSRDEMGATGTAIWVMGADGSNETKVMEGRDPSWSPDGTRIAFMRYDDGGFQIWTTSPNGTSVKRLTEGNHDHMYPTWSPDGRQLAFEYDHDSVAIIDAAGTGASGGSPRIVAAKGSWNLSWSPDGLKLVIAPPGEGLWLVEVDGSGTAQIAKDGTQPSWQPLR
jgi:serine/threonine protein kinase